MAEHSPLPWRVEPENHDYPIRDANGSTVAMFVREADAAYIVEAVNKHRDLVTLATIAKGAADGIRLERDRLRDIMRGLVAILETITLEDHEIELLDEAREAIKEEKP